MSSLCYGAACIRIKVLTLFTMLNINNLSPYKTPYIFFKTFTSLMANNLKPYILEFTRCGLRLTQQIFLCSINVNVNGVAGNVEAGVLSALRFLQDEEGLRDTGLNRIGQDKLALAAKFIGLDGLPKIQRS